MAPIKRETIAIVIVSCHILSIMVDTQQIYKMSYIKCVHGTQYICSVYIPQTSTILQKRRNWKNSQPTKDQRQNAIVNGKYRSFAPS